MKDKPRKLTPKRASDLLKGFEAALNLQMGEIQENDSWLNTQKQKRKAEEKRKLATVKDNVTSKVGASCKVSKRSSEKLVVSVDRRVIPQLIETDTPSKRVSPVSYKI